MLLRLLEEGYPLDAVVFYDTGMEFMAIYLIRDKVKELLEARGVEFVELRPEEPFLHSMLEREIKYRNKDGFHYGYGWCGGPCRWGTKSKTRAIQKYKRSLGDTVIDYVGIAADEPNGWFWYENSPVGQVELYSILDRVSCWCCANKNLKELRNVYLYLPQYWDRLKDLQSKINRPFKGFYKDKPQGIFELEERFEKERACLTSGL